MKRTVQMAKPGNNIPAPRGKQKNKHRFHEIQLQRLQNEQVNMETEINKEINNEHSL